MAYRIVLFDVGNVLLKLKMPDFFARVQKACPKLDPATMELELKREGGMHLLYETGKASFDDFHQDLQKRFGLPWDRARTTMAPLCALVCVTVRSDPVCTTTTTARRLAKAAACVALVICETCATARATALTPRMQISRDLPQNIGQL